jgi:hypothetical protein
MARKTTRPKDRMPPEAKAAYRDLQKGAQSVGRAIAEAQKAVRKAERQVEMDARKRISNLRRDARTQIGELQSRQRDLGKMLKRLAGAAGGSWRDVKASAESMVADARTTASAVVERFRSALRTS